jgi:putative ABC transport system substrate-binding protein
MLAAELVRLNVEVIQASGDYAPKIAQQATGTIPILAFTDDVLGAGLVASLSRPGGNTTGLTILAPELSAKRLEILSEIVPGLSRVAALWDFAQIRPQLRRRAQLHDRRADGSTPA